MSSATPTNVTVDPQGIVVFEYDGVIRAQLGSELLAATITGTITETQIADNAISTPKLQAASVITAKLAAGSVVASKIGAEAVETAALKAGAVTAGKIAVSELSAITANVGTLTAGVIQGPTVRTGTVGARVNLDSAGLQAFNAGGEEVLQFSTATGNLFIKGELKAGSIVPATTITGLLTSAQINELAATKITGTIAETQIAPEAVSTPKLKAGSVVTAKLAAGAVTAEKIAVSELSALTANLGTVTAGLIKGVTIEGVTIKSLTRFVLKEASAEEIPEESAVVWSEPARESIGGRKEGEQHILDLRANWNNASTKESGRITAKVGGKGPGIVGQEGGMALLSVVAEAVGTIEVAARNQNTKTTTTRTIFDSEIRSHFPQMVAAARRFVLSGAVSAAGAKLNGEGFTVSRTAKGSYTIKLTTALSSAGSLYVEVNGPFTQIHKTSGPSTSEWSVLINGFNGLGGGSVTLENTDEPFSFFVIQH